MKKDKYKYWMEFAFIEAMKAFDKNEVPVGSIIVQNEKIVGRGFNLIETLNDPTAHAEIIAITAAASYLGSRRLDNCEMYVTLEPCPMCAGAIVLARIPRLFFGAYDHKAGACTSLYTITNDTRLNHRTHTIGGICEERSCLLLESFFAKQRQKSKKP